LKTVYISWCGFVEDTATLFADAAMLLVCSRSEAFGHVAVEAMAADTAVVLIRAARSCSTSWCGRQLAELSPPVLRRRHPTTVPYLVSS
jgi:hypothetical protein